MSKERLTAEEWLKEKGFTADSMFAQRLLHDMAANMTEFATEEVESAIAETYPKKFIEWINWEDDNDDFHFIRDYTTNTWLNAEENMKSLTTDEVYQYWLTQVRK
jgi:hypothetical protein